MKGQAPDRWAAAYTHNQLAWSGHIQAYRRLVACSHLACNRILACSHPVCNHLVAYRRLTVCSQFHKNIHMWAYRVRGSHQEEGMYRVDLLDLVDTSYLSKSQAQQRRDVTATIVTIIVLFYACCRVALFYSSFHSVGLVVLKAI